jgi:hypothetical protein
MRIAALEKEIDGYKKKIEDMKTENNKKIAYLTKMNNDLDKDKNRKEDNDNNNILLDKNKEINVKSLNNEEDIKKYQQDIESYQEKNTKMKEKNRSLRDTQNELLQKYNIFKKVKKII